MVSLMDQLTDVDAETIKAAIEKDKFHGGEPLESFSDSEAQKDSQHLH